MASTGWRAAVPASKGIRRAGLILAAILVGCTAGKDEELTIREQIKGVETEAKGPEAEVAAIGGDFVGMGQEALRDCAGAPDERFGPDQSVKLEQWVYHIEPPAGSENYCKATFSLKKGQVTNAVFTKRDGTRVDNISKCSALIDPCRQGERN